MAKINLEELAKKIVDEFSFSIEELTFQFRDDDARIMDTVDTFIYKDLDDNEQYSDVEYQEILNDIMPFIVLELMNRTKSIFNNLDTDERKTLSTPIKEYDIYKESNE